MSPTTPAQIAVQTKLREALSLHQRGAPAEARALYQAVLKLQPNNADALHLLGVLEAQTGDHKRAAALIARAISFNSRNPAFHYNHGAALQELGRLQEALAAYDKALSLKPDSPEVLNNRGNALQGLKRFGEALTSYDKALALRPDNAKALNNRGNALQALERHEEAIASYNKALALKPDYALALCSRGDALQKLGRFEEAVASYVGALAIDPDYAEAHYNCGNALQALGRFNEAIVCYDNTLVLAPDKAVAHGGRALALRRLGRFQEALAECDKALALKPDYAQALLDRGLTLHELNRLDDAIACYDRALVSNPADAEALNNRGAALQALRQFDQAIASYDKALACDPSNADAYTNRGSALQELKRFDEAVASYDRALALNPENAKAYANKGSALQELKRPDEALVCYDKASALQPRLDFLLGTYLRAQLQVCDWRALPENIEKLKARVGAAEKVTPPFATIALLDDPHLQRIAAETWVQTKHPPAAASIQFMQQAREKIRVGYYSADFHDHATTYLMAEMLEQHDAGRFELYGFSFGPDADDTMRGRVSAAFDRFIDLRSSNDQEAANLSRDLGIDIAVDLKGFTADARPSLFAHRCAPIQVSFLGYPGTMGAGYIDYIIADRIVIPPASRQYYTENVVTLPHSYQANDSKREILECAFTKPEVGLPERGFVFCCFNNNYKITPATFDRWMNILSAVDDSVLWLLQDNAAAANNLRREAEARHIDSKRLVFAERKPMNEHLARQRLADLFIDTLPCNAHTTASDALWTGLPVLTHAGQTFAGRVAASLLHDLDLPELVVNSADEYAAKAIELARNPEMLGALKARLERAKLTSALFDGRAFARSIERAYEAMMARYRQGLAPAALEIEPRA